MTMSVVYVTVDPCTLAEFDAGLGAIGAADFGAEEVEVHGGAVHVRLDLNRAAIDLLGEHLADACVDEYSAEYKALFPEEFEDDA
jgi:hypothetical protein